MIRHFPHSPQQPPPARGVEDVEVESKLQYYDFTFDNLGMILHNIHTPTRKTTIKGQ
jgi:hypothetical protein